MENKQTAVEWLIEGLEKLEYDLEKGNISLDDYIINTKWFKNRAKEKEKEQHIKTATHFFPTTLKREHFEHYTRDNLKFLQAFLQHLKDKEWL